jgi:A/G-specific adenine glycosylase
MELGALVCTPKAPRCSSCPLANNCWAFQNGKQSELPALELRPATSRKRFAAFVLQDKNQVLIRQRPAGVVNAHLWEFPNLEVGLTKRVSKKIAESQLNAPVANLDRLFEVNHSITRYRIKLEVFRATLEAGAFRGDSSWVSVSRLAQFPFSSAHKKIANSLQARTSHKLPFLSKAQQRLSFGVTSQKRVKSTGLIM